MKIQIDTTAKTIKIENEVSLSELVNALEKLLPEGEWKTYKLETNTHIVWSSPIVIERRTYPWQYPWLNPIYCGTGGGVGYPTTTISGGTGGASASLAQCHVYNGTQTAENTKGTYCIELN